MLLMINPQRVFSIESSNTETAQTKISDGVSDNTEPSVESTEQTSTPEERLGSNELPALESQNYEENWAIVSNVAELQTALKNQEPFIRLADSEEIFDFGSAEIPISANVTIDGNGRIISYNGGNLNKNTGLYTKVTGLSITLKNMSFGSSDYSVPAVGLYGIMQGTEATMLHVQDVSYFSNKSAQSFYLTHEDSEIHFYGTNVFMQQNPDGSQVEGHEFAECTNLYFEKDSQTVVVHNTDSYSSAVKMRGKPGTFSLAEGAEVDFTTNHHFIYSLDTNAGNLTLGKGAKLRVKGTNASKGEFYYNGRSATWTIGEDAELSIDYPKSIELSNDSTIYFSPGSTGMLSVSEGESVFKSGVGARSTFTIDNAQKIQFQGKAGTKSNPIGFSGGTKSFVFRDFQDDTPGYAVMANDSPLTFQQDPGAWTISTTTISRDVLPNTPDFTSAEKTKLQEANRITLERANPPIKLLSVEQEVQATEANFRLNEYELNNNDSVIQKVDYKIYSKQSTSPDNETEGLISERELNSLTETARFTELSEETEYWLYVRISCDPDRQSSGWLEVPFKTEREMINIDFPMEIGFHTKRLDGSQSIVPADEYRITNNSSFPVEVQAVELTEVSNPSEVQLLTAPDEKNEKDLLLYLTENNQHLGILTKGVQEKPLVFEGLTAKASTTLGFSGRYYGNPRQAKDVQYRLILSAARKE